MPSLTLVSICRTLRLPDRVPLGLPALRGPLVRAFSLGEEIVARASPRTSC